MADALNLSIIIINWKSADFVRKCLASICANTRGISLEIIVVDNASGDGCGEMIRTGFPTIRFIQSHENLGFARANNLGFENSTGGMLLFLNPDTEVVGPALERMVACLESMPNAGVVGAKLLNSDRSIQMSCVQSFPSILNQVLDADYLRRLFPKASLWGTRALFENTNTPIAVDVVSGACLMIRRSVFESVGLFSIHYFMYAEDTDLCYKVTQAGWKSYFAGDAVVIHHGGRSTDSKPENNFAAIMMRESILKFLHISRGNFYAATFRVTTALAALSRLCLLGFIYLVTLGRFHPQSIGPTITKWSRIFRWATGLENWVKESA